MQGADPEGLEARIRQHYGDGEGDEVEDSGVPGHVSGGEGFPSYILVPKMESSVKGKWLLFLSVALSVIHSHPFVVKQSGIIKRP